MLSLILACCLHVFVPMPKDVYISPYSFRVWEGDYDRAESKADYQQLRAIDRRETGGYSRFRALETDNQGAQQNEDAYGY